MPSFVHQRAVIDHSLWSAASEDCGKAGMAAELCNLYHLGCNLERDLVGLPV